MLIRKLLTLCLLVLIAAGSAHAISNVITIQGRLTDNVGAPLTGSYFVTLRFYPDAVGGVHFWSNGRTITAEDGFFTFDMDQEQFEIASNFKDDTSIWIGYTVGSDPEMTPRSRLSSTVYSKFVGTIDGAKGGSLSGGVFVFAPAADALWGVSYLNNANAKGLYGWHLAGPVDAAGVFGEARTNDYYGYGGRFMGGYVGSKSEVLATGSNTYYGARCEASTTSGSGTIYGVYGTAFGGTNNYAVYGSSAGAGSTYAGFFNGAVTVLGFLSKQGGGFRIDHPLDPENKYLQHSFVESPDMKNLYDGTVVLDASGTATVSLPDWFDEVNKEFRYQLTAIGAPAPNLHIAQKIANNQFVIAGGAAGLEISWAVTGIRKDVWAEENRMPVELAKPAGEQGKYLYPKGWNKTDELQIGAMSKEEKAKLERAEADRKAAPLPVKP